MADFIGTIKIFGGEYAPEGWKFCNGEELQVNDYQMLFSILNDRYGGDGIRTFNLPNLIGLPPVGFGKMEGGSFNSDKIGDYKGSRHFTIPKDKLKAGIPEIPINGTITIKVADLPANNAGATNRSFAKNTSAVTTPSVDRVEIYKQNPDFSGNIYLNPQAVSHKLETAQIPVTGKETQEDIVIEYTPPFIAVNFIIAVAGEYPMRP